MASLTPERDQQVKSLIDQWIRKEVESNKKYPGMNEERVYRRIESRLGNFLWDKFFFDQEPSPSGTEYLSRVVREIQIVDPSFSESDLEKWSWGDDQDDGARYM